MSNAGFGSLYAQIDRIAAIPGPRTVAKRHAAAAATSLKNGA